MKNVLIEKCVMVINEDLPLGIIANTAAIMGITLGKLFPEAVGPDVLDQAGRPHLGIISIPVPILKADKEKILEIREHLYQPEYSDVTAIDFSDVAQSCNDYDDFIAKAGAVEVGRWTYFGIGICGGKKAVNRLTGSLPLLR